MANLKQFVNKETRKVKIYLVLFPLSPNVYMYLPQVKIANRRNMQITEERVKILFPIINTLSPGAYFFKKKQISVAILKSFYCQASIFVESTKRAFGKGKRLVTCIKFKIN